MFCGDRNVLDFQERVEELVVSYGYSKDRLLQCVPLLLKDKLLLWYRNNKRDWANWDEFALDLKKFYLPSGAEIELEEQIQNRVQGSNELAKEYITNLQTLIRRFDKMSTDAQLTRLYHNLRPEYKRYIKKNEFTKVAELTKLTGDYEQMIAQEKSKPPNMKPAKTMNPLIINEYNAKTHCWRCGQQGHHRNQCENKLVIFCSRCGTLGKS
ncbi:Protein of unknown function [Cotesia congregata]|uniref:CCHC-type domain-containing protein n=1 Tax=Cotesia congregata TaxID=51543 RepID=A0A8J2MC46_COTCN|nr:Protein of unknown function [Cotesia congregata]